MMEVQLSEAIKDCPGVSGRFVGVQPYEGLPYPHPHLAAHEGSTIGGIDARRQLSWLLQGTHMPVFAVGQCALLRRFHFNV